MFFDRRQNLSTKLYYLLYHENMNMERPVMFFEMNLSCHPPVRKESEHKTDREVKKQPLESILRRIQHEPFSKRQIWRELSGSCGTVRGMWMSRSWRRRLSTSTSRRSSSTRRTSLTASADRRWRSSSTSWTRWKFPYWQNPWLQNLPLDAEKRRDLHGHTVLCPQPQDLSFLTTVKPSAARFFWSG